MKKPSSQRMVRSSGGLEINRLMAGFNLLACTPAPNMTIATITPAEEAVARELHALLQEAYTREAEQIGAERFPPLEETVEDLQRSPDTFLGARWCDALIGALSFTAGSAHAVTITRLVVHPAHFRTGIATALLNALEKRVVPATIITVRTAR